MLLLKRAMELQELDLTWEQDVGYLLGLCIIPNTRLRLIHGMFKDMNPRGDSAAPFLAVY